MRTRALVFRKNECFTRERGIVQEVSGRGVLFGTLALGGPCQIGLCPRPICPRPRISAARRTFVVYPSRADSRYPRTSGGGQDRWQSAVRVLAVGRVVGGKIVVPPTITRYKGLFKRVAVWEECKSEWF